MPLYIYTYIHTHAIIRVLFAYLIIGLADMHEIGVIYMCIYMQACMYIEHANFKACHT